MDVIDKRSLAEEEGNKQYIFVFYLCSVH